MYRSTIESAIKHISASCLYLTWRRYLCSSGNTMMKKLISAQQVKVGSLHFPLVQFIGSYFNKKKRKSVHWNLSWPKFNYFLICNQIYLYIISFNLLFQSSLLSLFSHYLFTEMIDHVVNYISGLNFTYFWNCVYSRVTAVVKWPKDDVEKVSALGTKFFDFLLRWKIISLCL